MQTFSSCGEKTEIEKKSDNKSSKNQTTNQTKPKTEQTQSAAVFPQKTNQKYQKYQKSKKTRQQQNQLQQPLDDIIDDSIDLRNLSFEKLWYEDTSKPQRWLMRENNFSYDYKIDESINFEGKRSLKIYSKNNSYNPAENFGLVTQYAFTHNLIGRKIIYSGYLKTDLNQEQHGRINSNAGLSVRAIDENRQKVKIQEISKSRIVNCQNNWGRMELEFVVPKGANEISFGLILRGKGSAWFDNIEVKVLPQYNF